MVIVFQVYSNTTLVKVKSKTLTINQLNMFYSNTTLVKVKLQIIALSQILGTHSNTTLVKVKLKNTWTEKEYVTEFKYNSC